MRSARRPQGTIQLDLVAGAGEHSEAAASGELQSFDHQTALADPRLALDERRLQTSARRTLDECAQNDLIVRPANEWDLRDLRPSSERSHSPILGMRTSRWQRVRRRERRSYPSSATASPSDFETWRQSWHTDVRAGTHLRALTRLDGTRTRATGGAGLGLAISKEIVERHGGTIAVADPAPGARLVVTLPAA